MKRFGFIEFDASKVLHRFVIKDIKKIILRTFENGQKFDVDLAINAVYGFGDNYKSHYTRPKLEIFCNEAIKQLIDEGKIKQDYFINSSKPTYFIEKTQEIIKDDKEDYQQ